MTVAPGFSSKLRSKVTSVVNLRGIGIGGILQDMAEARPTGRDRPRLRLSKMAARDNKKGRQQDEIRSRFGSLRGIVPILALISGAINLLGLTGSFYMLQVYDRVLSSRSVPTLVSL